MILLGLSSLPYNKFSDENKALQAKVKAAEKTAASEEKKARSIKEELSRFNLPDSEGRPLNIIVQEANYTIRDLAAKHDVISSGVRVKTQSGASSIDANAIGAPFAQAPTLKYVTLTLDGEYRDLEKFKAFLIELRTRGGAISSLTIRKDRFTLSLDVYGV